MEGRTGRVIFTLHWCNKKNCWTEMGKCLLDCTFFFFFAISWVAPTAYGDSQGRGLIGATTASLCHSHSNAGIWATSATYTTAHGNTGSLTHWARPGVEPPTSWFLVGFVATVPWWELLFHVFWNSAFMFIIVMYSWWIDPFIITNCLSLSLNNFCLQFYLSDIILTILDIFCLFFTWYIFFLSF